MKKKMQLDNPLGDKIKEGLKIAFGGLSHKYYTRQAIIGAGIAIILTWISMPRSQPSLAHVSFILSMLINTIFYPYAHLVYEKGKAFFAGDTEPFGNDLLGYLLRITLILMCFMFATLLGPLGLLYIYYVRTQDDEDVEALEETVKKGALKAKKALQEGAEKVKEKFDDLTDEDEIKKAKSALKDKSEKVKEQFEDDDEPSLLDKLKEKFSSDDDEEEEVKPKRKVKVQEDEDEEEEIIKPKQKAKVEEDDEDEEEVIKPKRKTKVQEDETDEDEEPIIKPRKKS